MKNKKNHGKLRLFVVIGTAVCAVFVLSGVFSPSEQNIASAKNKKVSLIRPITQNKYGFLSGGDNDAALIRAYGARWVRPHPGPFLWDSMQNSSASAYSFANTDKLVKYSRKKVAILATLWPFAEWDQLNKADPEGCKVSDEDIFLPVSDKGPDKGSVEYLPQHRCLPNDMTAYENWVKAVVERYDGDGRHDMKGLKVPIKYWEVMNEPDLSGSDDTLDFWKGDEADYATLLIHTYSAIKEADPNARVLIAAAAGGDDQFLDFYRFVFSDSQAKNSFDIANVHCISSGFTDSLNVEPYKNMLSEFGLSNKSIWVTEAEVITSSDPSVNAAQTYDAVKKARQLGASRIFFTRYNFSDSGDYGSYDKLSKRRYKRITKIK